MIEEESKQKVLDATKIVDVVSDYVQLKKSGKCYVGLCPFHEDHDPSFRVFPGTGTYKCFVCGAGGDAISFLEKTESISFPEAVKRLGRKFNVEVAETAETEEQIATRKHKESLWAANELLANKYHELFLESKEAQAYAYNTRKWKKEYCELRTIGFAPAHASIVRTLGLDDRVIKDLGLLNQSGNDFFQNRLMIPIKDKHQHIIGFTARDLGKDSKCKYLNSMDSLIYNKSSSLFGIDLAFQKMGIKDSVYLVEGAPDCMRLQSIGAENTVADLGTAWTERHFEMLAKRVSNVCFLPDYDVPKAGEKFGPGFKAVFKAGRMAIEKGLTVQVKVIPQQEDGLKHDPDDFYKSMKEFEEVQEKDFLSWLASIKFGAAESAKDKSEIVKEIAYLLSCIDDPTLVNMYISDLQKFGISRKEWKDSLEQESNRKKIEKKKEHSHDESSMEELGFYIKVNCYVSNGEGGYKEWSNFIMEPLFHVQDSINPKRLFKLKNNRQQECLVEFKAEDMVSMQRFKTKIEGIGNFIWKANLNELTRLKSLLFGKMESAKEVKQLGWQEEGFYAFGNGVLNDKKFISVNEYGIVRLGAKGIFYLPAFSQIYEHDSSLFKFEKSFSHYGFSETSLQVFTHQIFTVFGNNGKVGFCFYLATLFRDIVTSTTRFFPILNLFGPKGSGKSEMGHTLMSFFMINNIPPNIQNSTIPALNDTVASAANALAHIDEFKNEIEIVKIEFLKGLWDGTGRTRMNMDLDKKKETTSVKSGIILSGQEMPTLDIALFSRVIFLPFTQSSFTAIQKEEYRKLTEMRSDGMTHLTIGILKLRDKVEREFAKSYHQVASEIGTKLKEHMIEDRILNNWVVPLAVFRCLETELDVEISYDEMFNIAINGIINQNKECGSNNELGEFWNTVQFLSSNGELYENGDYRIRYEDTFHFYEKNKEDLKFGETTPILYLSRSRVFKLYQQSRKSTGEHCIGEHTLMIYLQNSTAYLATKVCQFNVMNHGVPVIIGKNKVKTRQERTLCFNYKILKKNYYLSLETRVENEEMSDEEEDESDDSDG